MKNKYFYTLNNEETIVKLNVDDYHYFSNLATKLDPVQSVTESDSYLIALQNHLNEEQQSIANQRFIQLNSSEASKEFFKTCIEVNLLEKKFRECGIDQADIITYNTIIKKYNDLLYINQKQFSEQEPTRNI